MKYPFIVFFRHEEYSEIDKFFETNKDKLLCSVFITSDPKELNKLFNANYQVLVTFGEESKYYRDVNSIIANRMRKQWLHFTTIDNVDSFNTGVNNCYINIVSDPHEQKRVKFSLFTTCYKSYQKIYRAYDSIKAQTFKDWEWVILDDSPEDEHFVFLKTTFKDDHRIRLYKRSENSGSIGNVKNEAVSLCRGKYVLEMDHDDEILPDTITDAVAVFERDDSIGFIYMDFINIYENKSNFKYGDFFALGYSGYYRQKYNNMWVNVVSTPNINNVTLSHIVAVPNHPRIWRRSTLMDMGNYSEYLPISDDYELLVKTAVNTKMAKIHKFAYIQYMNDGGNNFSYIRNGEINRLRHLLTRDCYPKYKVNEVMKQENAYEDETYTRNFSQIWKRHDFEHKYCNQIINLNYKKQYCILGLSTLYENLVEIVQLYQDRSNDFLLLDNRFSSDSDTLCHELDKLSLDRMKCYSMNDCTDEQLVKYFMLIYKSCDEYHIYNRTVLPEEPFVGERKKVTIITPSIRPENLLKIKESIRFEYVNEWIIVYDGKKILENPHQFDTGADCEKITEHVYLGEGTSGNPQRNYALDHVKNPDTYLYFLDDDTIIHSDLYELLDVVKDGKMYTFDQKRPADVFPFKEVLKGDNVKVFNIDTGMMLIDFNLCKDIRWTIDKYNSDGIYITECFSRNIMKWEYVNKVMSYYNREPTVLK